jgi:hypothetical protein
VPVLLFTTTAYNEEVSPVPAHVYAVARRPDEMMFFLFDILSRNGAPFPAGYEYQNRNR